MARRTVALLMTLGLLAVGCGGEESSDADLLAERVERVAALVDAGRDCDAVTAAAVVGELAAVADVSDDVGQEVVAFARAATAQLACNPAPGPTPSATPTDPGDDDDDKGDKKPEEDRKRAEEAQKKREEERNKDEEKRQKEQRKDDDDDD